MQLKSILTVTLVFLGMSLAWAQPNPRQLKSDALKYFEKAKFPEALNLFLKYQRLKPTDDEVKPKMGICFYHTNNTTEALKYLQYVANTGKKSDPAIYYFIARSYHANLDYTNAIKFYKTFLRETKPGTDMRAAVKDDIRRCAKAIRLSQGEEIAVVENLGEKVNSVYDDFAPVLSPNYDSKIYFSSTRQNSGGLRNSEGLEEPLYGFYRSDMYSSVVVNGEWTATTPFNSLLNSPLHDVIMDFNSDGSVMYFFKGNDIYSGDILIDSFSKTQQSLFPDKFTGPSVALDGDRDLHFFNDSILMFASYRAGGYGGADLYISTYTQGRWTQPKNLGPTVNGPYDERTPFLARDGRTLYFSSNSTNSIGGLDVFKARYDDKTTSWSEPVNMGLPINSAGDDAFFRLSKDGLKAFFSSSRKESIGERDLYVAYFKGYQSEQRQASIPIAFHLVPEFKRRQAEGTLVLSTPDMPIPSGGIDTNVPTYSESEISQYEFEALYFGTDDNVLTVNNIRELNEVARLMVQHPQLKLQLTSNYDGSSPAEFDLFFSIKRAEKAAKYLIQNGVDPKQVFVKGCGSQYPVVKAMTENGPNTLGMKYNRRIDLDFYDMEGLPINIRVKGPEIQARIQDTRGRYYYQSTRGLSYKIQVAAIRQNYSSDVIMTYPDAQVEQMPEETIYRYSVGLYSTYQAAAVLRSELEGRGLTDAFIVPYVNGLRISRNDLSVYSKVYPDLINFMVNTEGR